MLVGRARERELLARALTALVAGTGSVVFVEGEAGIGKSRLLAHLAGEAAAAGCTVLEARASAFEGDLPYAVFTEALDGHLAGRRLDRLGLADPAALARALPALAALAPEPAAPDRHRTHRALRDLLERLAAARPLVLCLDDLHWADPASVEALVALVGRPPAAPVLLGRGGARQPGARAAAGGARRGAARAPAARPGARAAVGGRGGASSSARPRRPCTRRPAATRSISSSSRGWSLPGRASRARAPTARSRPR